MSSYTTTLDKICAYLDAALDGDAEVYRNQLPPGFDNTDAAVVVTMQSERHHQSKADRLVSFEIRVYGGTAVASDAAVLGEEVTDLINNGRSAAVNIIRIGDVQGQELPPEIDTGWPSYRITARARIRNNEGSET
jgi:hypothetical protein